MCFFKIDLSCSCKLGITGALVGLPGHGPDAQSSTCIRCIHKLAISLSVPGGAEGSSLCIYHRNVQHAPLHASDADRGADILAKTKKTGQGSSNVKFATCRGRDEAHKLHLERHPEVCSTHRTQSLKRRVAQEQHSHFKGMMRTCRLSFDA